MEEIKQLSILPGLSEDPSVEGLLRVEEQVPMAITMVHWQQYHRIIESQNVRGWKEPLWVIVEDRYELVFSRHCLCCLFLASEKNATTTCRKALAHRAASGLARVDL